MKVKMHNLVESIRTLLGRTKDHIEDTAIHVTGADRAKINGAFSASGEFLNGPDVNYDLLEPNKIYRVGDPTGAQGAPPEMWGVLVSYQTADSFIVQEYYAGVANRKYMRQGHDGGVGWSSWVATGFTQDTLNSWNAGANAASRFPQACQHISDWNTATLNGMYMATNAANAPENSSSWHMGVVFAHAHNWTVQKVVRFSDINNTREFERRQVDGVWMDWRETSPTLSYNGAAPSGMVLLSANAGWFVNQPIDFICERVGRAVHVHGMLIANLATPQTNIATFPVGFRPARNVSSLTVYCVHWPDKYRGAIVDSVGNVTLKDSSNTPQGAAIFLTGSFYTL